MKKLFLLFSFLFNSLFLFPSFADETASTEETIQEEVEETPEIDSIDEEKAPVKKEEKTQNQNKISEKKKNNSKKTNKPKFTIKKPENLIFQDQNLEIYKSKMGMSKDWLSPYYLMHKVVLVNLTDSELVINGDILNKISKEEANRKVFQLAQEKKARSNAAYNGAALNGGLLGAAVMAGSIGADIAIDKGRSEILAQIKKLVDDKAFSITIPAKEESAFSFLFTRQKDEQAQILLSYNKVNSPEKTFIIKNFNETLGQELLQNAELYKLAYIDSKITDKKIGAYLINAPKPKGKDEIDNSYEMANFISTINLIKPETGIENTDKKKKNNALRRLEGLTSSNIYPAKNLRIFIYQNIKKQPDKFALSLVKLTPNKKEAYRSIPNNLQSFSLKEIKDGIFELRPSPVLASGEYLLVDENENIGIEFTIEKPKPKQKTKK